MTHIAKDTIEELKANVLAEISVAAHNVERGVHGFNHMVKALLENVSDHFSRVLHEDIHAAGVKAESALKDVEGVVKAIGAAEGSAHV